MKGLFYCTKNKPNIVKSLDNKFYVSNALKSEGIQNFALNGFIVAEFEFDIEFVDPDDVPEMCENWDWLIEGAHINIQDISKGYAIHIKNVEVFETYRKLDEFCTGKWIEYNSGPVYWICDCKPIKPTQVGVVHDAKTNNYVRTLFPVSPDDLRNILNGEQNMLFRKKLPKEITVYERHQRTRRKNSI